MLVVTPDWLMPAWLCDYAKSVQGVKSKGTIILQSNFQAFVLKEFITFVAAACPLVSQPPYTEDRNGITYTNHHLKMVKQKTMCIVTFLCCSQTLLTCANTYLNSTLAVNDPSKMAVYKHYQVVTSKSTTHYKLIKSSRLVVSHFVAKQVMQPAL